MKKLSKLVAFATSLVAVTAFTIIGCSDISSSGDDSSATVTSGTANRIESAKSIALTIDVTADSNLVDFSSAEDESTRTLTPVTLDSTKVKFYLGGTDLVTNEKLTIKEVTFVKKGSSTKEGTITLDLDPSNYRFTLVALPKMKNGEIDVTGTTKADDDPTNFTALSAYVSNAVLIGYANADLRYSSESEHINFKMTSDGLTGNGKLSLKFYLKGWSTNSKSQRADANNSESAYVIASAKIGLYDIKTGELIADSEVSSQDFTSKESTSNTVDYTGGTVGASLPAGTYDFRVTFTRTNTEGVTKTYPFGDSIMILPGQVTTATLGIPDLLELAPIAPTEFTVGYIPPTNGEYDDSDYYKVIFNWKEDDTNDGSKVEQYFEIQLYDITTSTDIVPAAFKTAGENKAENWASSDAGSAEAVNENTYRYNTQFYGLTEYYYYSGTGNSAVKNIIEKAPTWYCGSLQKDNHCAGFYVELGKRYLARIRAVNAVDKSPWVYSKGYNVTAPTVTLTKDIDVTREESAIGTTRTDTAVKFNTDIINLFRIKYERNGGSFTSGALSSVYYFDQLAEGNPIMVPNGTATISLETDVVNSAAGAATSYTPTNFAKPYNGGQAITLKDSTGTQTWVSWKLWGADGKKSAYPTVFTKATTYPTSGDIPVYYVTETLASADVNGSTTGYKIASSQPTDETSLTSTDYYTTDGLPTNYKGYKNLTLYANYTNNTTFTVELANKADFRLEENVTFKVVGSGGGEGTQPVFGTAGVVEAYDQIKVFRSGVDDSSKSYTTTLLTFSWTLKEGSTVKYDKVVLSIDQANSGNVYVYDMTTGTAKWAISTLQPGIYTATLKGYLMSNSKVPYELPITIRLN